MNKRDASVLEPEIIIDNFKNLSCDRDKHGGGVAGYKRDDLSYYTLSVFSCVIENIFYYFLPPNSKPIIVGTIYRP